MNEIYLVVWKDSGKVCTWCMSSEMAKRACAHDQKVVRLHK